MKQSVAHVVAFTRGRPRPPGARFRLRLGVYARRGRLDRQIGSGAPWGATPALALRAEQLIDPRSRRRLAHNLRWAVEYVDRLGSRPDFSAVMLDRRAVRAGREAILGLVERLEGSDLVSPRGIVLAQSLITDGCASPLVNANCGRTVVQAVWEIADALGAEITVEFDGPTG